MRKIISIILLFFLVFSYLDLSVKSKVKMKTKKSTIKIDNKMMVKFFRAFLCFFMFYKSNLDLGERDISSISPFFIL